VDEITGLIGRRVWDSRGRPTVEVEVRSGPSRGRALAPAGASTGSGERLDRRDGGRRLGGFDVLDAVAAVNDVIAPALVGRFLGDQAVLDAILVDLDGTPDRSRLGANATVATSMALAWAAAAAAGQPLWRHLGGGERMPVPEIQIFGGGAHAAGRLDLQDLMVVAPGARCVSEALEWTAEVYLAAGGLLAERGQRAGVADEGGWWPAFTSNEEAIASLVVAIERAGFSPGDQVAVSLDVAATELSQGGLYRLALDDRVLDSDAMKELILSWLRRYPIVAVEDPLDEHDLEGTAAFTAEAGAGVLVVADDLTVTDAGRVRAAAQAGAANTLLVKPNQAGTVTEALAARQAAAASGWRAIVSARSGETEDVTVSHLAVGWSVDLVKVGSIARGERTAKWNELLRIEEDLGEQASFAGWTPWTGPGANCSAGW
jgi:enolase